MKNIVIQEIDTSNGVIFPFYDADTNIIYLCGKVSVVDVDFVSAIDTFSNQIIQQQRFLTSYTCM